MSEPQDPVPDSAASTPSRGRLIAVGAGALTACLAIIAGAIWLLLNPAPPGPKPEPTATVSSTAPSTTEEPDDPHDAHLHDDGPHRHGAAELVGEPAEQAPTAGDVEVAEVWVRTLLGWTPQERDSRAALARATDLAPGVHLEHLAAAVLDHAAALAAGAAAPNAVDILEVTDPTIWPTGWVVLDAAVRTAGDPQAGVHELVLHVTCEIEVADGQVVTALIGDGAAWIEQPA